MWGAGYRFHRDELSNPSAFFLSYREPAREYGVVSGFVQDEISLIDDELTLTVGTKLSHNDFTGVEVQPSARILWMPTQTQAVWAAVSRAVRTPSRIEDDGRYPIAAFPSMGGPPGGVYLVQTGNSDIKSETLMAYEVGYREQVTEQFAWDLAGFYHDFDNVLSSTSLPPILPPFAPEGGLVLPRLFENDGVARAYGFEFSSSWQATEAWRMFGSYSFLRAEADGSPAPTDARNQFYVQSSWDVTTDLQFDSILRYVDNQYGASSYTAMDLRLAWQPSDGVEVFVVGRHLLDQEHDELVRDPVARTAGTQVEREVFGGVVLRF